MIQLLYADSSCLSDEKLFNRAISRIPECRREKVKNVIPQKSKMQSLGASLLLTAGLGDAGFSLDDIEISEGPHGRPYLDKREDIFFSISHSGKYCACTIGDCNVGCDIEAVNYDKKNNQLRISERFFTGKESEYIRSISDEKRQTEAFYRLWTLKESYIKYLGLGLSLPLNTFEFTYDACKDQMKPGFKLLRSSRESSNEDCMRALTDDEGDLSSYKNITTEPNFIEIKVADDYAFSLCYDGKKGYSDKDIIIRKTDLTDIIK